MEREILRMRIMNSKWEILRASGEGHTTMRTRTIEKVRVVERCRRLSSFAQRRNGESANERTRSADCSLGS